MNQQKAHDTKHFANFKNVGYLRVLYGRKEFLIYIVFDVINGLLFDVDWGVIYVYPVQVHLLIAFIEGN